MHAKNCSSTDLHASKIFTPRNVVHFRTTGNDEYSDQNSVIRPSNW